MSSSNAAVCDDAIELGVEGLICMGVVRWGWEKVASLRFDQNDI